MNNTRLYYEIIPDLESRNLIKVHDIKGSKKKFYLLNLESYVIAQSVAPSSQGSAIRRDIEKITRMLEFSCFRENPFACEIG